MNKLFLGQRVILWSVPDREGISYETYADVIDSDQDGITVTPYTAHYKEFTSSGTPLGEPTTLTARPMTFYPWHQIASIQHQEMAE